jgi:ABC-type molybdate transport system permease subunit
MVLTHEQPMSSQISAGNAAAMGTAIEGAVTVSFFGNIWGKTKTIAQSIKQAVQRAVARAFPCRNRNHDN